MATRGNSYVQSHAFSHSSHKWSCMLVQTWLTLAKTSSFQAHGVISSSKYVAQKCGFELGCGVGSS